MRLSKEREETIKQRLNRVSPASAVRAHHKSRESKVYARINEAIENMARVSKQMENDAANQGSFHMYLSDLSAEDRNSTINRILELGAGIGYTMCHGVDQRTTGNAERFTMTLPEEKTDA